MPAAPQFCGSALKESHYPLSASGESSALQDFHCPTVPRQCGSALQDLHRICTAYCPHAVRQGIARVPPPTAARSVEVDCGSCSPHCPQGDIALQELHYPLPLGSAALHCKSSTAPCPQANWQCTAGVALPAAPRYCSSALQGLHLPLPLCTEATRSTCGMTTAIRQ